MRIVNSIIYNETTDLNTGNRTITEHHTYDNGQIYPYLYIAGPAWDVNAIMNTRAAKMNAEFECRELEVAETNNFEIPLTQLDIQRRITPDEWAAFMALTSNDAKLFQAIFNNSANVIHRNDPLTQAGRQLLIATGVLTAERDAVVFA